MKVSLYLLEGKKNPNLGVHVAKTSTSVGSPIASFLWSPASPPGPSRSRGFMVSFCCEWRGTYFWSRRPETRVMKFGQSCCQMDGSQRDLRITSETYYPDLCLHLVAAVKERPRSSHAAERCYSVMSGQMSALFQSVIFVPLQYHELLILSCGPFSPRLHFLEKTSISTRA